MATSTTVPDDFGSGGKGLSPNANSPTLVEILQDHEEQINESITADLSDAAPASGGGTATAGVSTEASRDDHIHAFALKKTVTIAYDHADFLASGSDGVEAAIDIGTDLPANAIVIAHRVKVTTPFAGVGLATLKLDVGGTDDDALVAAYDILDLAAGQYAGTAGVHPTGPMTAQQLVATFDPDASAGLDELTAGELTIDVYYFIAA